MRKVEGGDPSVGLGIAFEAAAMNAAFDLRTHSARLPARDRAMVSEVLDSGR